MDRQIETEVAKFNPEDDEVYDSEDEKKKDKKTKKEKKKDKKKKDDETHVTEITTIKKERPPEVEPAIKMEGLKSVKLTASTQQLLNCVVGEHVTSESPWTTIDKEIIDESLKKDSASDFKPLKKDFSVYKESEVLVGYDPDYIPYEDENIHRFYIAVTETAKEAIVNKLSEERRIAEERLKNSINKTVRPWHSHGSEIEVDDSIPTNTRPLIELELETDIDELLKPVHFRDRNVQDAKDGYVRMGPGRQEFTGVKKMRVDASVQAVPPVNPNFAQTDPGLPMNAWSQYVYDMGTAQEAIQRGEGKDLDPGHKFGEEAYLEKALEYNETFDLYTNDYPLLVVREDDAKIPSKSIFEEYQAYTDVRHCKSKYISSIAWHPMWSGIVALAYSVSMRCLPATEIDPNLDEVTQDVFSRNIILIWSFKDALKPRLILESPREVYTISWCPTNPNILVGGCASGQIIIWDVRGKLEAVEGQEYLTPDQQRYRLVMESLIGWVQSQPPVQYVRPAALSNLNSSHGGRVSQIQWLAPYFDWTEGGHFQKVKVNQGQKGMQIISCGEDGLVMVWDLNKEPPDQPAASGAPPKVKKRKARKRPSALTANVSLFKSYDRKIRPIYKLFPELPAERSIKMVLTGLSFKTPSVNYELDVEIVPETEIEVKVEEEVKKEEEKEGSESPKSSSSEEVKETPKDEEEFAKEEMEKSPRPILPRLESVEKERRDSITYRELYRPVMAPPDALPARQLQLATDEGDSVLIQWEGFDFHKGETITSEGGSIQSWGTSVHDGPVVTCVRSPFLTDLILTIGGKVVAVWKETLKNQPLFWKSSPVRVTCGCWSPYRPCMFYVGRSDGSLEIWDLSVRSDLPTLVQSISGKALTAMNEHTLPLYGECNILGVADYNNSFRLLYFPDEYKEPRPNELETLKSFVEREILLRQNYNAWNDNYLKSNAEELAKAKELEEEEEKARKEAERIAEHEAQVRAKLEEEETKRLGKSRHVYSSVSDRYLERLREERERQMQRVLMEKKRLDKTELMAKQQPILLMKQMEKEKKRKQKDKIKQQQKIFDKTVAMLFPEVIEKPKEEPSRTDEFEKELMALQSDLMEDYKDLAQMQLELIKENPFNEKLNWKKVFEEGRERRNVLDFPLYLRQKRLERFVNRKDHPQGYIPPHLQPVPYVPDTSRRRIKAAMKEEMMQEMVEGEEEDEYLFLEAEEGDEEEEEYKGETEKSI